MFGCYFRQKSPEVRAAVLIQSSGDLVLADLCMLLLTLSSFTIPKSLCCVPLVEELNWPRMSLCFYCECLLPACGLGREEVFWPFWGAVANSILQTDRQAGMGYPALYLLLTSAGCAGIGELPLQ